jgi:hypothetical protein
MNFKKITKNNRVEIEIENNNFNDRLLRGMVLDVFNETDEFIIVDEFGNLKIIDYNNVLNIEKIKFDKIITDALYNYKEYYKKKKSYEEKLQDLKNQFPLLQEHILDAHFLAKFNIHGAFIRINKYIPENLKNFHSHDLKYQIKLGYNLNDEIEINITVLKEFDYYEVTPKIIDKIKKQNKPDKYKELSDVFKDEVIEQNSFLNHIEKDTYEVGTKYLILISINKENYLNKKDFILKAIHKLKKII